MTIWIWQVGVCFEKNGAQLHIQGVDLSEQLCNMLHMHLAEVKLLYHNWSPSWLWSHYFYGLKMGHTRYPNSRDCLKIRKWESFHGGIKTKSRRNKRYRPILVEEFFGYYEPSIACPSKTITIWTARIIAKNTQDSCSSCRRCLVFLLQLWDFMPSSLSNYDIKDPRSSR